MKEIPQLHHMQCYGIIDRDYRSQYEIDKLKDHGIYTIAVAEVENLFIVEELLAIVNEMMGHSDNSRIDNTINYIVDERYANQLNRQVCEAVVAEIKYLLSSAEISKKNENEAKQSLTDLFNGIDFATIKKQKEEAFNDALTTRNYGGILSQFNCKSVASSVGHFFGIRNEEYMDFVLRQISGQNQERIITALKGYMPIEIPFE